MIHFREALSFDARLDALAAQTGAAAGYVPASFGELFGYQGPLRLVVATDKAPARGVCLLEQIEIVRLAKS